jgi:hypothetical protein
MNADVAALITAARRHLDDHLFGTTTLFVFDHRAIGRAGVSVLAGRTIRHGKDEIEISVERDRNLHLCDREIFVVMRDFGSGARIFGNLALNTLVLEVGPSLQRSLLILERILAGEAIEVETAKVIEVSCWEGVPFEASLLFRSTQIVGIRGIAEGFCIAPACCGSLLQEKTSRPGGV